MTNHNATYRASATIREDGTGEISVNGQQRSIAAPDLDQARAQATRILIEASRTSGQDIHASMGDPWGTWPIIIRPDGRIDADPNPTTTEAIPERADQAEVIPSPAPAAGHLRTGESSAHYPTQSGSTAAPHVVPPHSAAESAWAASVPSAHESARARLPEQSQVVTAAPVTEDPSSTPALSLSELPSPGQQSLQAPAHPPAERFRWENDPAWKIEAAKPATQGIRAVFRLKPGNDELNDRRTAFAQTKEEEASLRAEEEQQRAEAERVQAHRAERRRQRDQERDAHTRKLNRSIQTNFQGTKTILVANPKGGARKTTTTYLLAATIGSTRGGSTVAWDANETMGTLGERAQPDRHNHTVVDLLENGAKHFLDIDSARVGVLDNYVRTQGDAHFDVLASDEDPNRQDQIDAEGFNKVHDILAHFYRMILVDTGNNIRASHFIEAQSHTDQLVIPVAASHDSKNRALDMISAFTAAGHDDLVANAVVLVHELEPLERDEEGNVTSHTDHELTAAEIKEAFTRHVRTVLPIPYDSALKDGGRIDYFTLAPDTIAAYREAAAAITDAIDDGARGNRPGRRARQGD